MAIDPDHLLEQAERLVTPHQGRTPSEVDLRRAISSSYYGLFHAISIEAADFFIGRKNRSTPRYKLLYRSIDHRPLRTVCEDINKRNLPQKYISYQPRGGFGDDIKALASAVVRLQDLRHSADYDPLYPVSTSDVMFAVKEARNAIRSLSSAGAERKRAFVSLVVIRPRSDSTGDAP